MKYTPEIRDEFATLLSQGMGRVDACSLADICYDTFLEWLRNKPEFAESIKKAEAKCKQRNIALIQKAALTTWQAAAWWLERKYKDEFALRMQNVDLSPKRELSKQAVDAAMSALKLLEEAGRNANTGRGSSRNTDGLGDGSSSLQAKGPPV